MACAPSARSAGAIVDSHEGPTGWASVKSRVTLLDCNPRDQALIGK
jgi:hypothetical protein